MLSYKNNELNEIKVMVLLYIFSFIYITLVGYEQILSILEILNY